MDFSNSSSMKIFRLDANYSSLKTNLQCILQSHLISPFPIGARENSPLVIIVSEPTELFAQRSPQAWGHLCHSSRDQPTVGTKDMTVSGLVKGKIISFQQLQGLCLPG